MNSNDAVSSKCNVNNNNVKVHTPDKNKPEVPTKPNFLVPSKAQPIPKDLVTPRGWHGHNEFSFPNSMQGQSVGKEPTTSNDAPKFGLSQAWRPAPKVISKEQNKVPLKHVVDNNTEPAFKTSVKSNDFHALKRLWGEKTDAVMLPRQTDDDDIDQVSDTLESAGLIQNDLVISDTSSSVESSSSTSLRSSKSSSSIHTSSFKRKQQTWHYVSATSPTEEASSQPPTHVHDGSKSVSYFQSPKPFRSQSVDNDESALVKYRRSFSSRKIIDKKAVKIDEEYELSTDEPSSDYMELQRDETDVSPDSAVPPPLLPRGSHTSSFQDYTPMAGTDPAPRDSRYLRDIGSQSSTIEVNYEPMEPVSLEDYTAAVDPPQEKYLFNRASIREYHEIDPDVPPPPQRDPPQPPATNTQYIPGMEVTKTVEKPPPLPPMNFGDKKSKKKLNYIEVDIVKTQKSSHAKLKHAKTNYTEVMVGDPKKEKSVKGKIMSMFTSKHDGYHSEGDAVEDQTTEFSKERNKLKRISGRFMKKKRKPNKETTRNSTDLDTSASQFVDSDNVEVGVYGSAPSESFAASKAPVGYTASLDDIHSNQIQEKANRRQSCDPALNGQRHSEMDRKFHSNSQLDVVGILTKALSHSEISEQSRSAENTPYHRRKSHGNSPPVTLVPRIQSHLHGVVDSNGEKARSPERPFSESYLAEHDTKHRILRPASSPCGIAVEYTPQLSPTLPNLPPPQPPVHPSVKVESFENHNIKPPAPMRELKPNRFRKHGKISEQTEVYSHAEDIPMVMMRGNSPDGIDEPIYDDVYPETLVPSPTSTSKFLSSEPLYQVYRSRTLSHASMKIRQMSDRQPEGRPKSDVVRQTGEDKWQSELMTDDAGATTLWREVPEVVKSGRAENLTNEEMKVQQAQFEVITSQASYLRSLNILVEHFMSNWAMESTDILPKAERKHLFSSIEAVREVEEKFLKEIEEHFWNSIYLTDVAKITAKYARSDFDVYVRYVQNQVYQDRILTDLQRKNERFAAELCQLESSPACNKLPLLSFLLLPMQRVTRLPLLISAIVNHADALQDRTLYDSAKQALVVVNKLVKKCNEGARKMQQTEQLVEIASELGFAPKVKTYAIVSPSRALVKKGEMMVNVVQENKKAKLSKLHLFLFTDVLLIARKKSFLEVSSNIKYEVFDWAKRAMLFINERAVSEKEIFLVLLENCIGKRVEITLFPSSQNELSRWTDALNPTKMEESGDSIYESWDCPQYECILPYTAQQPDELSLDVYDIMRIIRKTTDGWLEGERLRDNETGWFPAENTREIEDEHVRVRNLRNLYRILPAGNTQ